MFPKGAEKSPRPETTRLGHSDWAPHDVPHLRIRSSDDDDDNDDTEDDDDNDGGGDGVGDSVVTKNPPPQPPHHPKMLLPSEIATAYAISVPLPRTKANLLTPPPRNFRPRDCHLISLRQIGTVDRSEVRRVETESCRTAGNFCLAADHRSRQSRLCSRGDICRFSRQWSEFGLFVGFRAWSR
ncbi:hypothetical protein M433DRAFT_199422 [Acidomyces richmondensis BFW]|nr:MAG: hypothetical protein FE78DRAFT_397258 [Acidomyces sp. 'richmondensis']KYG40548.1 hypothetical protein M433DRAFT_199422 [Acidomyces richmondensis BFW]